MRGSRKISYSAIANKNSVYGIELWNEGTKINNERAREVEIRVRLSFAKLNEVKIWLLGDS